MQPSTILAAALSLALPAMAVPAPKANPCGNLTPLEGLTQGGYRLAHAIDSNNATLLDQVFTNDTYYDSSALAPYGGISKGKKETIAAIQAANTNAMMSHLVTNLYVLEYQSPTQARVLTSITWTHWTPSALDDIQKTFRIFYECDDIWVCQNGGWSLKHSVVKNMGPGVEQPYNTKILGGAKTNASKTS